MFRQGPPGGTGANHPEHPLHHQAMIEGWPSPRRLRRWQDQAEVLPLLVGESRNSSQGHRSGWGERHRRRLACTTLLREVLRALLMPTPETRPPQAVSLRFLRLAQCLKEAADFRHAQRHAFVNISRLFSCSQACARITTSAA